MEKKQIYNDDIFQDTKSKKYYTGEYLEHNEWMKKERSFTKISDPYNELQGETITCNYDQIFYHDSTLLLCNNIPQVDELLFDNIENGSFTTYYDADGNETDEENAVDQSEVDIFQYYLIDAGTAERLKDHTDEIIFFSDKLDLYVLCVTHCGTSWDYVDAEFVY
jgi:hypothetical protein